MKQCYQTENGLEQNPSDFLAVPLGQRRNLTILCNHSVKWKPVYGKEKALLSTS